MLRLRKKGTESSSSNVERIYIVGETLEYSPGTHLSNKRDSINGENFEGYGLYTSMDHFHQFHMSSWKGTEWVRTPVEEYWQPIICEPTQSTKVRLGMYVCIIYHRLFEWEIRNKNLHQLSTLMSTCPTLHGPLFSAPPLAWLNYSSQLHFLQTPPCMHRSSTPSHS